MPYTVFSEKKKNRLGNKCLMICSNCIIHTYKKDWDKNHNVNVGYFGDMITVKQNKTKPFFFTLV